MLSNDIKSILDTDTNLNISGAAADAKTVGDIVGNIANLNTTATNLVESINEVALNTNNLLNNLSLGINDNDGLLYIYLDGSPIGDGVDISTNFTGTRYSIAYSLNNVTISPQLSSIIEGRTLLTTITPSSGYTIRDVVVTMNNNDISSTVYNKNNRTITITNVAGNISISITAKSGYAEGRLLLWEDDFDTFDSDIWGYELGYIRNNEKQYYTSDTKNCYVSDSVLHLVALKDNPYGNYEWSSASIDSSYNFPNGHGFYYGNGLIETKIKIPLTSSGVWPAWWSVGAIKAATCVSGSYTRYGMSWPNATEVDMLDYIGKSAISPGISPGVIYQNNPYSSSANTLPKTIVANGGKYDLSDGEWHILGMEYTPTQLKFYQDRVLISTIDISNVTNLSGNIAFPLKYNLAMGSTSGEIPSDLTRAEFMVDWVRYYAPANTQEQEITNLTASINNFPNALNKNKEIPLSPLILE